MISNRLSLGEDMQSTRLSATTGGSAPARATAKDVVSATQHELERLLYATSTSGVGTWEVHGNRFVLWDAVTLRLYGYSPGTKVSPSEAFRAALSEKEYRRCKAWIRSIFTTQEVSYLEFSIRLPNGQTRWLQSTASLYVDDLNPEGYVLGVNWDVTDRKLLQEESRKLNKNLERIKSDVIDREENIRKSIVYHLHDVLGQNLTALSMCTKQIFESLGRASSIGNEFSEINKDINNLISDSLCKIRIALSSFQDPPAQEVQLIEVLEGEVVSANKTAGFPLLSLYRYIYSIDLVVPTNVLTVIQKVVREAIFNVLRHSAATESHVSLTVNSDYIIIRIVDNGIGISHSSIEGGGGGHFGIKSMHDRANSIGARLRISKNSFGGTSVVFHWRSSP